jgi:hypothetical protein
MSALGQKRTSGHVRVMSALPPKADIAERECHVRFVPKADIGSIHLFLDAVPNEATAFKTCQFFLFRLKSAALVLLS